MSDLRIVLTLERPAVVRVAPDGRTVLEVHARFGAVAVVAVQRFGTGAAAQHAAHQNARHLHRGERVLVHAAAMHVVHHPGQALHLAITGVDFIEHLGVHAVHEPRGLQEQPAP